MDQEQQPSKQIAGDRLLKALGIDPNKWTVGDRRLALLAIILVLVIAIIAVCGYVFGWEWTGLAKRTFWDWLSLLIVPVVLALGGYFFTRSENRRTREDADQQRSLDRELADERRQDDMLQAYLDGMSQLLTDKDRPLHRAAMRDSLSTVARARTLTVLTRLDGERRGSVVRFLYESGLTTKDRPILDLSGADLIGANLSEADLSGVDLSQALLMRANLWQAGLSGANLSGANLFEANLSDANLIGSISIGSILSEANLRGANLSGADLISANLSAADLTAAEVTKEQLERTSSLEGATMPNGQKYEEWLKDKEDRGKEA